MRSGTHDLRTTTTTVTFGQTIARVELDRIGSALRTRTSIPACRKLPYHSAPIQLQTHETDRGHRISIRTSNHSCKHRRFQNWKRANRLDLHTLRSDSVPLQDTLQHQQSAYRQRLRNKLYKSLHPIILMWVPPRTQRLRISIN